MDEAIAHLEERKQEALKRISERGDRVLRDDSRVYQDFIWTGPTKLEGSELYSSSQTDTLKWFTWLALVTEQMIEDLKNMRNIDVQASEEALVKELQSMEDKEILRQLFELGMNK